MCIEKSTEMLTGGETRAAVQHSQKQKHAWSWVHTHTPKHVVTQTDTHSYTSTLAHAHTFANSLYTRAHGYTDTHSLEYMHKEPPDPRPGLPLWLRQDP